MKNMTWEKFAKVYNPKLGEEEIDYLLMNWTAYPFADIKFTVKQFLRAIRMHRNKIKICWECSMPEFMEHKKNCSCKYK